MHPEPDYAYFMRARVKLLLIIAAALLLRLGLLYYNTIQHPSFFQRNATAIQSEIDTASLPYVNNFGFEIGNIAYALVCTQQGFASPFGGTTGPTAWTAPGIVMMYALAFKLFGCFSSKALLCLFGLALLSSILILVLIYKTSLLLFNNTNIALASALVFAVSLQDTELYFKGYQQDFNLYSFVFISIFYLFLKYFRNPTQIRLAMFSICAGISLFFVPVLLCPILFVFVVSFIKAKKGRLRALTDAAVCLCIIGIITAPYILYQKNRIGTYCFIKSNGVFELSQGNCRESDGYLDRDLFTQKHPAASREQFLQYKNMGEASYVRSKFSVFLNEFELRRFSYTTLKRLLYYFFIFRFPYEVPGFTFWTLLRYLGYALPGLSLLAYPLLRTKRSAGDTIFVYVYIAGYALPYILIAVMYRYSFPISALTSLLTGVLLHQACVALGTTKKNYGGTES